MTSFIEECYAHYPLSFHPHVYTLPLLLTIIEWVCPAETDIIGVSFIVFSAIILIHYDDHGFEYTSLKSISTFKSMTLVKKFIFFNEYGVRVFSSPVY